MTFERGNVYRHKKFSKGIEVFAREVRYGSRWILFVYWLIRGNVVTGEDVIYILDEDLGDWEHVE